MLDRWHREFPGCLRLHAWDQLGGERVRGLTFADDGHSRPVRILVAVPHAHEPAPTSAIVDLAAQLLGELRWDIQYPGSAREATLSRPGTLDGLLSRCLITLLPDTNSQGRARSPRRQWVGEDDNDAFLKTAFGELIDGSRFPRLPEWRASEVPLRRPGIVFEEVEPGRWVEPNTSRLSTHRRAVDELFGRYRYTHYLEMHQHEGDEAALLPADFEQACGSEREAVEAWAGAVLAAWEGAGVRHKGAYIPYAGQARQELFRAFWTGRCPGMLRLTTETRNNRHILTDEPTTWDRQILSASVALVGSLKHLCIPGMAQ